MMHVCRWIFGLAGIRIRRHTWYTQAMDTNPFAGKPTAESLYRKLLERVQEIGSSTEELKKTSVHVVAGSGAFLGVHPRATSLLLNIVLDHAIESPRISKGEQVSKTRYHNE